MPSSVPGRHVVFQCCLGSCHPHPRSHLQKCIVSPANALCSSSLPPSMRCQLLAQSFRVSSTIGLGSYQTTRWPSCLSLCRVTPEHTETPTHPSEPFPVLTLMRPHCIPSQQLLAVLSSPGPPSPSTLLTTRTPLFHLRVQDPGAHPVGSCQCCLGGCASQLHSECLQPETGSRRGAGARDASATWKLAVLGHPGQAYRMSLLSLWVVL